MERMDEETQRQESSRRGSGQVRWTRAQRGQAAGQSRKWPQGWLGQEPGKNYCGTAQCTATTAGTSEEVVNTVIALIRARYGESSIGRGDRGIRYHCHS
jgi:hypothetical protein